MKAIKYRRYGSADVLQLEEVDKPAVEDDKVVVRVHAASVNPLDWHSVRGKPYVARASRGLLRPKNPGVGADFAGRVEAVGGAVTEFRPGDEVFGLSIRTCAEYVRVSLDGVVRKPANLTFEQAAAVGVAAITALQGLRDKGRIRAGQKVLINGAAGGVGTFAVQIAKSFGAETTGVCSTRNVDLVRSIGADQVIDYTQQDFTRTGQRYDLVFDVVGNRPLSDLRRALTSDGTVVLAGATDGQWLGPVVQWFKARLLSRFVSQKLVPFLSSRNRDDLVFLKELLEAGTLTPVIDRTYPLRETADAMRYLEDGHARGKVVITV